MLYLLSAIFIFKKVILEVQLSVLDINILIFHMSTYSIKSNWLFSQMINSSLFLYLSPSPPHLSLSLSLFTVVFFNS